MTKNAYSSHTIARTVYDSIAEAIRTNDIVATGSGANATANETIPGASTEIGSNAGSRKAGILIILQDTNALYIAIGEAATVNHAKLAAEGDFIFLPTNDSVYGLSASTSDISWVEI